MIIIIILRLSHLSCILFKGKSQVNERSIDSTTEKEAATATAATKAVGPQHRKEADRV